MRRSLLFIPANSPAMMQNADIFQADAVIFDLEDAIALQEKDSARILLSQFMIHQTLKNVELCVRINGMDTEFYYQDLISILNRKLDTIVLPKASIEALTLLDRLLFRFELERSLGKTITIIPIIETTQGVLDMEKIASFDRVSGILLGGEDLTSDLEVKRSVEGMEILYPRMKLAYVCKARGMDAIDTPFTHVQDEAGLLQDAKLARSLGISSKCAIHPNQIPVIHEVFSPSEADIDQAQRILIAKEEAEKLGKGVFSLDGKMVDKPIIERAMKTIEKAKKFHLL